MYKRKALKEQVVVDVIISAFGSAGQRCSALRLLFLPHETADDVLDCLMGAMDELVLGDPAHLSTCHLSSSDAAY